MSGGSQKRSECDGGRVPVLLPYPFPGPFDYVVPPDLHVAPGDVVLVPLNRREEVGVIWDAPPDRAVPDHKLKPVIGVLDTPPMREDLRRFVDWMAAYTLSPPGEVMAMALRVARPAPLPAAGWRRIEPAPEGVRMTPARERVLAVLARAEPRGTGELARAAEVGAAVIRGMADAGLLASVPMPAVPPFARPDPDTRGPVLSDDQEQAAATLRQAVADRSFSVTLLDGVTGSGKTEVYLEAVAECLRQNRQALVLLPEIALSSQWLERFTRRFGVAPAVWHSDLTSRVRRTTWRAVAEGAAPVVVGARSALFLPFPDLGLVVVDEEHETAFKQEEGVVYHARDMAVVRARFCTAPAVLVSATPSLETVANVEAGRYTRLHLPVRHGGAVLPEVRAIDLRLTPPERGKFLSPPLVEAVQATLARGEQAMLFLNRRGYAPLTLCRHCGHRMQCPNCTAWLVEHRIRRELQCHHCGHTIPIPPECPACGAAHSLTPVGPGVERITEEAAAWFPDARRLVMASDTIPGPDAAALAARAIEAREVDLVIGTQIVAKGWHFPHLTLVGVVDADLGLAGGDLRAAERTVQLLHQVAGRAGRAEAPGRVLLQTFSPEHPVMQALVRGDLEAFMASEAAQRRPGHWPPYGRLAALIVSADTGPEADALARDLGRAAPFGDGVTVLGPAPAPLSILRGRHRRRLLLKTRRDVAVQPILRDWLAKVAVPRGARVEVDVDPVSFM
ncbi:MAG: primosomal protein N' [Rhodospirillales bacterium 69-11]|nr:primosomal protein N' [Rhodospirillales bacterium]OJW20635.1 MAG: primosomal protein N' [Rhodospirillales bacterium 69-11]